MTTAGAAALEDFHAYRRDPTRARRNALVLAHRGLAVSRARRYAGRGIPLDDLVQVASLGLLKAVERFDPDRGVSFAAFASPTVDGELKRHFRDAGWSTAASSRVKDLHVRVQAGIERLVRRDGAAPTVAELAAEVGDTEEHVVEALAAGVSRHTASLSATPDDGPALGDRLGEDDAEVRALERRLTVRSLLASLPDRERRIVELRFYDELTQAEIADRLGISQMHVSRLLRRTLGSLAERFET